MSAPARGTSRGSSTGRGDKGKDKKAREKELEAAKKKKEAAEAERKKGDYIPHISPSTITLTYCSHSRRGGPSGPKASMGMGDEAAWSCSSRARATAGGCR